MCVRVRRGEIAAQEKQERGKERERERERRE
jgi:hypothetical protein